MNINKPCKVCSKRGKIVCDKCRKVIYCSRTCQFNDWNLHKVNCNWAITPQTNKMRKSMQNPHTKKKQFGDFNSIKRRSSTFLIEKKFKKRASIKIKKSEKKRGDEYPKLENFNFLNKFYEILFKSHHDDSSITNSLNSNILRKGLLSEKDILRNEKREKIKQIQNLLIEHRKFLLENILLNSSKKKYYKYLNFMIDTYSSIESYIFNFLLLIKFLYSLKDPINLIKADQALKLLGNELFIFTPNNKQCLLEYSLDKILQRFLEELQSKNIYKSLNSITNVLKRFLSIISSIIKISQFLGDYIIYQKALSYYDKIFTISLKFISTNKETEKTILKCNFDFNLASIFIKNKYINSAIILYKNIIQAQRKVEPCTFLNGIVYYNISILYFVMDKLKDSEFFLNEGLEKINKLFDSKNFVRHAESLKKLTRMFILFYAEIYLERQNYDKANECLKIIIENMIDNNKNTRGRHISTISKSEVSSLSALNQLKSLLGKYLSTSNSYSYANKKGTRLNREEIQIKDNRFLSALDCLYEVKFYSTNSDNALFDEIIKNYINGFLERINSLYLEKEKREKEKQKRKDVPKNEIIKKEDNKINSTKSTNEKKLIFENEDNLPDLDLTNIVKINNSEPDIDANHFIRGRNKTITKQVGKNLLKERVLENMNKENINNTNNNISKKSNDKLFLNAEISKKILLYINNKILKKKKALDIEKNLSDFEYFFLLLTSLSYHQMEILNETQIKNTKDIKYIDLPILFSKQFKNSLNPSQKKMFNKLRVLSLIRCKILKDPNLPISIDNLNFKVFTNIDFEGFKIKNKNIPDIIQDINKSEQNKKRTINNRKFKKNVPLKKESLFSFFDGAENTKNIVKNYLHYKIKNIKKESDSEDDIDDTDKNIDSDLEFKYQNEYDINILKKKLTKKINKKKSLSKKQKELYIDIIKSNEFIQLMNQFDLQTIKEFDTKEEILLKLMENIKKISMKEYKKYKNLNNKNIQYNSSDSSFSIDISVNNSINYIK